MSNKGGNLFSYLSKLKKKIQVNQGHQIFHIIFLLVYFGLLKGDKSDSSRFRMAIFRFLLFSSYSLGQL
jgi:hypothetical protein